MKNGNMEDKLKMQERELKESKQYITGENKKELQQSSEKENMISCNLDSKADNKHSYNQQSNSSGDSMLSIFYWEMAIITMQHRQRIYRHRNARRKRREG